MEKIDYFMVSLACSFHKPKSSFEEIVRQTFNYVLNLTLIHFVVADFVFIRSL